jgi:hypothetical protein
MACGLSILVCALHLPISLPARFRPVIRVLLISMAVASIISYFHVDVRDTVGDIDKMTEVLLVMLVTVDAGISDAREEPAGRGKRPSRILGGGRNATKEEAKRCTAWSARLRSCSSGLCSGSRCS